MMKMNVIIVKDLLKILINLIKYKFDNKFN